LAGIGELRVRSAVLAVQAAVEDTTQARAVREPQDRETMVVPAAKVIPSMSVAVVAVPERSAVMGQELQREMAATV
jgi:hypothetical protein